MRSLAHENADHPRHASRHEFPSKMTGPLVCFERWGEIPSDDSRALQLPDVSPGEHHFAQHGFYLVNDGDPAHEITVEAFEIEPSVVTASATIRRIERDGKGFALVGLAGFPSHMFEIRKWDLIGAMAKTSKDKYGGALFSPDFSVTVSAIYRDADERWYRSTARLTYIRTQRRLEFGPTTRLEMAPTSSSPSAAGEPQEGEADFRPQEKEAVPPAVPEVELASGATETAMYERLINPLKVRLVRKEISPEETVTELRAMAEDERYPVKLRAHILDELAPTEPPTTRDDSATVALREALRQPSDKIRRNAMAMMLDRIIETPAMKDYHAAQRYNERILGLRGAPATEASLSSGAVENIPQAVDSAAPPSESSGELSASQYSQAEGKLSEVNFRVKPEIQILGPDDVQLMIRPASNRYDATILSRSAEHSVIRPSTDCFLWVIQNHSLRALPEMGLEITAVQTFDARKSAFREPVNIGFRWPVIRQLGAGERTNPLLFLVIDGDHLRLSTADGTPVLRWPSGDESAIRRLRLRMNVTGLSEEWPIELDLRWTPETRTLELAQDRTGAFGVRGVAPETPESKTPRPRGRKRKFTKEQLDRANQMKLKKKPNQEIAKVLYGLAPTDAQRRSVPTILKHHFGSKNNAKKVEQ
jgi:hypothetical protein